MNRLTRNLLIAGAAGATVLGGLGLTTATSSAQTPTTQDQPAAASGTTADPGAPVDMTGADCHGGHHRGPNLDVAAQAIGISADDLRTALEGGQTMAQVAQAHGVEPQTVIDALVADVHSHLDEQVSSGEITQAEADTRLAEAQTRIADHVQNGKPAGERPPVAPSDSSTSS